MPALEILMKLRDEVTTKLKEVVELLESFTGKTEELAEKQEEPIKKTAEHEEEIKRLQETAGEYGRTQTDILESVAALEEETTEKTEEHKKAIEILTEIAGEYGARQTDISETIAEAEEGLISLTEDRQTKIYDLVFVLLGFLGRLFLQASDLFQDVRLPCAVVFGYFGKGLYCFLVILRLLGGCFLQYSQGF